MENPTRNPINGSYIYPGSDEYRNWIKQCESLDLIFKDFHGNYYVKKENRLPFTSKPDRAPPATKINFNENDINIIRNKIIKLYEKNSIVKLKLKDGEIITGKLDTINYSKKFLFINDMTIPFSNIESYHLINNDTSKENQFDIENLEKEYFKIDHDSNIIIFTLINGEKIKATVNVYRKKNILSLITDDGYVDIPFDDIASYDFLIDKEKPFTGKPDRATLVKKVEEQRCPECNGIINNQDMLNENLIRSIIDNNYSKFNDLIQNGADVDLDELLYFAAGYGRINFVKYLVENGADIHANGLENPLYTAVFENHLDVVKYLIEHGADPNARTLINPYIGSPLSTAAAKGYYDIVKYLVENGADIHNNNDEALIRAARYGHEDIVKYLKAMLNI